MVEWEQSSHSTMTTAGQTQTYVKPEAAITVFERLVMSDVLLETCQAIKKHWNNKFYYTVASCWLFL
jgi:predicted DCC family thiol-disulfide oxidoreductase YuxK